MCNDGQPWGDWTFGDWWDSEPLDPRLVEIQKIHNEILEFKRQAESRSEIVKELIINLENKMYNGLTYLEYIKLQEGKVFTQDDITIKIKYETIYGERTIKDKNTIYTLSYNIGIKKGSTGSERMYTPRKTYNIIPNKHKEKLEELKEECYKYQVEDITTVWRRLYGLDAKQSNFWEW